VNDTAAQQQGTIKKIDPRDNYNRLGIELPGSSKWLWISYFGNLAPNSVGADISFAMCTDSKGRPYISEYAVTQAGSGQNPPLGYNPNNGGSHRPPQGSQPPPQPTAQSPPAAAPARPEDRPVDALLEFTLGLTRLYLELGEGEGIDGCIDKAADHAMRLEVRFRDYRSGRGPGRRKSLENVPDTNPAAMAEKLEKRATGEKEPDPDEFTDDIPF